MSHASEGSDPPRSTGKEKNGAAAVSPPPSVAAPPPLLVPPLLLAGAGEWSLLRAAACASGSGVASTVSVPSEVSPRRLRW